MTQSGCESGTTPFPIGVGMKGILLDSINSRISFSARPYAAPVDRHIQKKFNKENTCFKHYTFTGEGGGVGEGVQAILRCRDMSQTK